MTRRVKALALSVALPTFIAAHAALAAGALPAASHSAVSAVAADGSTTKQLSGGAVLHLSRGARIEMGRSIKLLLGPPGATETVTQVVKLLEGRVDIDITPSRVPRTAVLIEAPHKASAVAKGGHSIAIADADRVTFAAVDGDMLAASGNDWKGLPAGMVRGFIGSDPTPQEHAVPGVPQLDLQRPILLALDGQSPATAANVGGVAQAEHYELSVWRVGDSGNELVERVQAPGPVGNISGLAPGHYQVSARAVDSTGIFGKESELRQLRVVGAQLPEGARFENGVILLGHHGRVKLVGADGLEASYGQSSHFVRAPSTVGLAHGDGTLLRLREPGAHNEVQLGLEPRTLRADVEIGPKKATWPQDQVSVTVKLFDAHGKAVADNVNVKPTVLVDVQPVDVNWTRSGNLLTASIPKPKGEGPWVVRVEVTDEFGDPAGRDFLEIAGPDTRHASAR